MQWSFQEGQERGWLDQPASTRASTADRLITAAITRPIDASCMQMHFA